MYVLMVPSKLPLHNSARPLNSMFPGACVGLKRKPPLKLTRRRLSNINGFEVSCCGQPVVPNQGGGDDEGEGNDDGDVTAILLGDGSDSEGRGGGGGGGLWPLTKRRSAAALPMAANYRLIDVVVSNCIHSNITSILALTQYNSTSLNAHLNRAYSAFLQVIAAYQSPEHRAGSGWFQGDADTVRRCLAFLDHHATHLLILPAHNLYRMDYTRLIQTHRRSKADITISCVKPTQHGKDRDFGCLTVDSQSMDVVGVTHNNSTPGPDTDPGMDLTSMGVYVISKQVLVRMLRDYFPFANDFRRQVIPGAMSLGMKVKAYVFQGYWDGMDSISTFYQAGMEMTKQDQTTGYNFYDREYPVYTLPHCCPPSEIAGSLITNSVIGGGCFLNEGCRISGSILGLRTRVGCGAVVEDSIIMGSDTYQEFIGTSNKEDNVSIGIGDGSLLRKAIVDKNARIGKRVMIINKDNVQEGSRKDDNYAVVDGIVVVMRSAVIPDGTIL